MLLCYEMPFYGIDVEKTKSNILAGKLTFKQALWSKRDWKAIDFVQKGLDADPITRPTSDQMLKHPFLRGEDEDSDEFMEDF